MKLATSTGDFDRFCRSYIQRIKNIQDAGFKYIDLSLYTIAEEDELLISDNWKNNALDIKKYMEKNGLEFVQSHSPGVNPLESDEDFKFSVEITSRAIEICGLLDIPNIVVHPGKAKDISKEEWFERNRRFFKELFPVMEENGVMVLHENTTSVNVPWYWPKTGKDMREFSEFVNHPLFHSCWDTGHANMEGAQYEHILDMGSDLRALHINDNRGERDEHIIPFFGTVNMDEIMHALKDVGYSGCFTFESGSTLRPDKYWLGNRRKFDKDRRLVNPTVELQKELEGFMYHIGEYILKAYDEFEG